MKTRAEIYGQEASDLLRDLSMYKVLTKKQVLALYPGKRKVIENLLNYLIDHRRIWQVGDFYCSAPENTDNIDRSLLAAVWVLVDFIDRVEFHSVADFPAKLIFFADGEIYEIIYAGIGREALVSYLASSGQSKISTNYLVMVDKPEQILDLQIPNACGYCTVSDAGEVQYYQKE